MQLKCEQEHARCDYRKLDVLHTDRYYYKKPISTNARLEKIVFYNQNLNLWGKHLQKMAGCNKYMTYSRTIESVIC